MTKGSTSLPSQQVQTLSWWRGAHCWSIIPNILSWWRGAHCWSIIPNILSCWRGAHCWSIIPNILFWWRGAHCWSIIPNILSWWRWTHCWSIIPNILKIPLLQGFHDGLLPQFPGRTSWNQTQAAMLYSAKIVKRLVSLGTFCYIISLTQSPNADSHGNKERNEAAPGNIMNMVIDR